MMGIGSFIGVLYRSIRLMLFIRRVARFPFGLGYGVVWVFYRGLRFLFLKVRGRKVPID